MTDGDSQPCGLCPWAAPLAAALADVAVAEAHITVTPADPCRAVRAALQTLTQTLRAQSAAQGCPMIAVLTHRLDALVQTLPSEPTEAAGPLAPASPEGQALLITRGGGAANAVLPLLEARGFCVQQAAGSVRGLVAIEEQPPDLVVLELGMPDVAGHSLAACVRSRLPEACVIGLAGGAAEPANTGGLDSVLTAETLASNLDKLLDRHGFWHRLALRRGLALAAHHPMHTPTTRP